MKEAFSGIYSIAFIVVFLVIVIGILGLVVSYTKAFKMKNIIISTIEKYEGSCCGGGNETNGTNSYSPTCTSPDSSACRKSIVEQAQGLGYNPVSLNCPNGYAKATAGGKEYFCYKISNPPRVEDGKRYVTYTIVTQVDINFPIINKMMGINIFQVNGDTKEIQLQY